MTIRLPEPPTATGRTAARRRIVVLMAGLAAVVLSATAAAAAVAPAVRVPPAWAVALLLVGLVGAATLNLEYRIGGHRDAFDHFEAVLVPALFFLPPVSVVVAAGLAKAVCQLLRRVAPLKAAYNVVQWCAATALGALVLGAGRAAAPDVPPLLLLVAAALVVVAINAAAVLAVLSAVQDRWPHLPDGSLALLTSTAVSGGVNILFGVLVVLVAGVAPQATPLLLVPLLLLHLASRGYAVGRVERTRRQVARHARTALTTGAEPGSGLSAFLAAVGYALDRGAVELLSSVGDRVEVRRWDRTGTTEHAVPGSELSPLRRALLELRAPVRLDADRGHGALRELAVAEGHTDVAAAPVGGGGQAAGVLALYDARAPTTWPDRELEVVADLAREVGTALEREALTRAVQEERAERSRIVEETEDGIVTLGPDGRVSTWNPALERLTGYAAAEVVGRALDLLDPVDLARRPVDLSAWPSGVADLPTELLVRTRGGARRCLSCSYAPSRREAGPDRLVVVARDITELRRVQTTLAAQTAVLEAIASGDPLSHSLQLLADAAASTADGVGCAVLLTSRTDPQQLVVASSAGVDPSVLRALDPLHADAVARWSVQGAEQRGPLVVTSRDRRRLPGEVVAAGVRWCALVPVRAPHADRVIGALTLLGGTAREGLARDLEDGMTRAAQLAAVAVARSEFEAQLAHQATHDALTGLANRAILMDRVGRALRGARGAAACALLFVDLDQFKVVNDTMGHDVGDQLLVEVAGRLQHIVRPSDTVARFGGDEFVVLCEHLDRPGTAVSLAHRVLSAFAEPFRLADGTLFVTASVGVALGERGSEADELVNDADAAMYRVKDRGGNGYEVFDVTMRRHTVAGLVSSSALRVALDRGELVVHYQPIVSLRSRAVVGAEALVRWEHPELGVLRPDAFLPQAESTGLIVPIGAHVVAAACAQARQWEHAGVAGSPLRMNINLSPRELGHPALAKTVADALESTGVTPSAICFEITESSLLRDVEATTATLRELKGLGVSLAIDDFGTGYSPLTYLRRFPVDGLKIDRSFVAGMAHDSGDLAIVTAVLSLAHSFGLSTVAEGVESAAQLARLGDLGCEAAQGYYFSPPRPPEEAISVSPAVA